MLRLIGRRLAIALPMLFVIATLTFGITSAIPGDPVVSILGPEAGAEQYAKLRADLGLDRPFWERYGDWMSHALQGDFGNSIISSRPVSTVISERLPVTISIALFAIAVTLVVGVGLGLIASLSEQWPGRLAQVLAVIGISIPNFWLGILLVLLFSLTLHWLPATGYTPISEDPSNWIRSLTLPVIAVAVSGIAAIARQTRASMNEVLAKDFVRTLLACGTPRHTIIFKHALRNASIPVVTALGFQFITLFGGAFIVEQVFALSGIGQLTISAVGNRDIPLIQGVVLFTAVIVIVVNLVVDVLYSVLNPKVRHA
jgi:peptide/nickel transport system permease protein